MSTSEDAKIIDALMGQFRTVTLPAGMQVAYPNVTFTPDGTNPYVRLTYAPNTPVNHHIGGPKMERMGVFSALVGWPVNKGINAPTDVAATIRDAFAYGTRLFLAGGGEVRVIDPPAIQGDIVDGAYTQIPVTILWHAYP